MQDHKRPQCPVFYPTMADMAGSFEDYIVRHEKRFAGVGICKIVAPSNWTPRKAGYTPVPDIQLARPIRQHVSALLDSKSGLCKSPGRRCRVHWIACFLRQWPVYRFAVMKLQQISQAWGQNPQLKPNIHYSRDTGYRLKGDIQNADA